MRKFGLIGYPLKHSFSPGYFSEKFRIEGIRDATYDLYELASIAEFPNLLNQGIDGLNVTIPYKEQVIPFLDELSDEAREIGAVNTIKFDSGILKGYNTDTWGFRLSLLEFCGDALPGNALILGSGGASKAVAYTLAKLGIQYKIVSRKSSFMSYSDLNSEIIRNTGLIVNTTPLGTWPNIMEKPDIPYTFLGPQHFLYDLVYNPEKTLFLTLGEKQGCSIKNGYDMLRLQAEKAWEIWND